MNIKKIISSMLALLFVFVFAGCGPMEDGVDDLLVAPKLEGDMSPVQQALEESVGAEITLKYPTSGDYRSAFILKDINGDARREAIALYSSTSDSTVSMHINLIAYDGDNWKSVGDISLVGSGVESVSFADIDGDGSLEVIIGWLVYGTVEKQVGVYTFDGNALLQRAIEPYTNTVCTDITGDGIDDLVVFHLNSSVKTASARVFSLSNAGITEVGIAALDGGVSSYSQPVINTLSDGTKAIFVDAVKGAGMLTEIVWFADGMLKSIYDPNLPETSLTYRPSTVGCRDYDNNGIIDLPLSEILISTAGLIDTDKVYYTNWSEFDGQGFRLIASTFMNYSDGYCITVPEHLKEKLLLIRRTEARMRFFYSYNAEMQTSGDELFRIVAATKSDMDNGTYTEGEYFHLGSAGNLIYLAKVIPDNTLGITEEFVREIFSIIK